MNREVKSLKLPFCLKHLEIFLRKSVQVVCLNFGDVNCKSMRNCRMADAHICTYFGYQLAMVCMVSPVPSCMIGND